MDDRNISPLNPVPAVVWLIVLPMIAMEIVLALGESGLVGGPGAIGWRMQAFQTFAFAPDYLRQMLAARVFPADGLMRLVSYPLASTSATTTLFLVVITLALGKFVGEVFRPLAILALFLAGVIGGALAYAAVPGAMTALSGGYPGTYGLIGGFTWVLWRRQQMTGQSQLRAFRLIGFLMGVRLVFGAVTLIVYGSAGGAGWDWVAELSGFAVGFALSFLVSPGGWAGLRGRLRG